MLVKPHYPVVNKNEKQICQVKGVSGEKLSDERISLSSFSAEELTEAQKQDGNLEHLREYLVSRAVSSAEDFFLCNAEVKFYHLERDFFRLDDSGVIWRQIRDPGDSERFLVPRTLRDEVMRLCHDIPSAGHQGVTRSKELFSSELLLVAHIR